MLSAAVCLYSFGEGFPGRSDSQLLYLPLNVCLSLLVCSAHPPHNFNAPSFFFFLFFLSFPISSPFISYTQEGLWQNNTSWKEKKKQIKTTFFQHRVCTVGPHELPGLEKQLGKLLLNRGNSFPRICLEMVWQVRALLWIHSKPAPLGVQRNLQEQPNQKHLSACHHSLWQHMYLNVKHLQVRPHNRNVLKWPGLLSSAVFDGGASIGALTDCLRCSCFCLISGTALVL